MLGIFVQGGPVHIKCGSEISLELIDMADLVPTISASERRWGICGGDDFLKVFECLIKVLLFFVNNANAKADFIGSFKFRRNVENGKKGFECVIQAAIAIVKQTNSIPKIWISGIRQMSECALICLVSLFQIISHYVAMGQNGPRLTACGIGRSSAL